MKKLFICLIGAIILSNCDISVKKTNAQNELTYGNVAIKEYTFEGMEYKAFIYEGSQKGGISVVNVTRDKLQCEIMEINIKKAKDGK